MELKHTGIDFQTLQDKVLILLLENNLRGGLSLVICESYVKLDGYKKIKYKDAINLHGYSMSQALPFVEIKIEKILLRRYIKYF